MNELTKKKQTTLTNGGGLVSRMEQEIEAIKTGQLDFNKATLVVKVRSAQVHENSNEIKRDNLAFRLAAAESKQPEIVERTITVKEKLRETQAA